MDKSIQSQYLIHGSIELPFSGLLETEELEKLQAHSNVVEYKNRDVIFLQNTRTSHIMFVKSGLVKIYKEGRNHKVFILKVETANQFLGLMSVFGHDLHQFSGAAIGPTEIYFIDIGFFKNLLQQNGRYAVKIISNLSSEGLFLFDRLIGQSHKQLPGRIADVLLYFSEIIYKSTNFEFPFTRRELAELAGTTKESFIRTLTEFKNDKIIDLEGSRVDIKSMKIVKTLSELG